MQAVDKAVFSRVYERIFMELAGRSLGIGSRV